MVTTPLGFLCPGRRPEKVSLFIRNFIMKEEDLIEHYQKEVDAIPEMRQLVSYSSEIKLECLKHLSENCSKDQEFKELIGSCMKHLQGKANPVIVTEVVVEWLNTE